MTSETSGTSIPVPEGLALDLSGAIARWGGDDVVTDGLGGPASTLGDRAMRRVRTMVPGLPETFVFHDLRHFFASSSIEAGFDVERVQALLGHASAETTLDTYGHLLPNQEDAVRVELGTLYASQPEADGLVTVQWGTG